MMVLLKFGILILKEETEKKEKEKSTGFKSHHVIPSVALPYTHIQRAPD